MKSKGLLILIAGLMLVQFACKKDNSSSPIIGKWQENKIRIYTKNVAGALLNDTTYSGATFTNLDYVQFFSNGTCVNSSDHEYYPSGDGYPKTPDHYISGGTLNYSAAGPQQYILSASGNLTNPGGFVTTDTAKLIDANNLLIHFTNYGHGTADQSISYDSYYTR